MTIATVPQPVFHGPARAVEAPLAPVNLLHAGVPAREVAWFEQLRPDKQFRALRTVRGQLLLEQVRSHMQAAVGEALERAAA